MKNKIKELDLDYIYYYGYAVEKGLNTKGYDEELMHSLAVIQDKLNEVIKEINKLKK